MEKNYTRLSDKERCAIYLSRKRGDSISKIGKLLGRHPSTISRELQRNKWTARMTEYNHLAAQNYATKRQATTHRKTPKLEKCPQIKEYIEEKIKEGWSPEIIAGRMKLEKRFSESLSYESIYKYIYKKKPDLCKFLRWYKKKKRNKRGHNYAQNSIPNKVFIDDRPKEINKRATIGHWETDTMEFSKKHNCGFAGVNINVERVARYVFLSPLKTKTSDENYQVITGRLKMLPSKMLQSMTFDNGSENAQHRKIAKALSIDTYFCHPYCSWEKGTVENRIGLIRFFLPKRKNVGIITEEAIAELEKKINSRPMKVLGFKTPHEVFWGVALAT